MLSSAAMPVWAWQAIGLHNNQTKWFRLTFNPTDRPRRTVSAPVGHWDSLAVGGPWVFASKVMRPNCADVKWERPTNFQHWAFPPDFYKKARGVGIPTFTRRFADAWATLSIAPCSTSQWRCLGRLKHTYVIGGHFEGH